MNTEPEGQLGFLTYSILRVLRHPRILRQINPLEALRAEADFSRHKVPVCTFASAVAGSTLSRASGTLCELDLPLSLQRYKARRCLFAVVRLLKPDVVVETGCGGGYSAAHILEAMELNGSGRLYSVDSATYYNPTYFDLPVGLPCGGLVPEHLRSRWQLLDGGAERELPQLLGTLGTIDLFIHDSLHDRSNMEFEYTIAWEHLRPGGVLISHDIWQPWVEFVHTVKRDYVVYQHYGAIVK